MDIRLLNSSTTSSAAASVAGASRTWSRKKLLTLPPRPLPAWMTRSSGRAWSELMPEQAAEALREGLVHVEDLGVREDRVQRRLGEALLRDALDRRAGPAACCRSGSTGRRWTPCRSWAGRTAPTPSPGCRRRCRTSGRRRTRWHRGAGTHWPSPRPTALSPTLPRMYVNVVRLSSTAPPARWAAASLERGRASKTRSIASNSVDLPTPELPVSRVPLRSTCIVWAPWNVPQLTTCTRARRIWPGLVSSPIGSMVAMLTWLLLRGCLQSPVCVG